MKNLKYYKNLIGNSLPKDKMDSYLKILKYAFENRNVIISYNDIVNVFTDIENSDVFEYILPLCTSIKLFDIVYQYNNNGIFSEIDSNAIIEANKNGYLKLPNSNVIKDYNNTFINFKVIKDITYE